MGFKIVASSAPTSLPGPARPAVRSTVGWLAILLISVGLRLYLQLNGLWPQPLLDPQRGPPGPVTPRGNLAEDERPTIELFRSVNQSVVHITTSLSCTTSA